tara:strand:- start:740 stop:1192 length:453 start_codon:yes stop_codon:yes gene_type:complete
MIPSAEHIAQARKLDDMCAREVDLSVRIDNGWFSCGRYRAISDEEDTRQGYWVCKAMEDEETWEMELALATKHTQIPEVVYTLLGQGGDGESWFTHHGLALGIPEYIYESINFLLFGTNDLDIINKLRIEDSLQSENTITFESMLDEEEA